MPRISNSLGAPAARRLVRRRLAGLFLVLGVFLAATAQADDEYRRTDVKTLAFRGGKVTIDNKFGDVVLRTQSGSNVSMKATVRASSSELGQQIRIVATEGTAGVTIRTVF